MVDHSFTEQDFLNIWGTVHRHDYTNDLAKRLITKYGKVSILDIGTGCGHLIKLLRELGCDAWGLELSEHAVYNACSWAVVRGDIRAIPFPSKRFDVVHSSGLWEYVPEFEVAQAVTECYRVGCIQDHNIDTDDTDWRDEYRYITWKPQEWWNKQLTQPSAS